MARQLLTFEGDYFFDVGVVGGDHFARESDDVPNDLHQSILVVAVILFKGVVNDLELRVCVRRVRIGLGVGVGGWWSRYLGSPAPSTAGAEGANPHPKNFHISPLISSMSCLNTLSIKFAKISTLPSSSGTVAAVEHCFAVVIVSTIGESPVAVSKVFPRCKSDRGRLSRTSWEKWRN